MATVCWSVKGGSGTSAVAAALTMLTRPGSLLVDLCGDAPALFGIDAPPDVGLSDWFDSSAETASLLSLCHTIDGDASLLSSARRLDRGDGVHPERYLALTGWIAKQQTERDVIVDAGTPSAEVAQMLLATGSRSLLVLRPCYLAVRRAVELTTRVDGIVVVREEGRSLSNADIESATGSRVLTEVPVDPAIARSIDAGMVNTRLPRSLRRSLRVLIDPARGFHPRSVERNDVA